MRENNVQNLHGLKKIKIKTHGKIKKDIVYKNIFNLLFIFIFSRIVHSSLPRIVSHCQIVICKGSLTRSRSHTPTYPHSVRKRQSARACMCTRILFATCALNGACGNRHAFSVINPHPRDDDDALLFDNEQKWCRLYYYTYLAVYINKPNQVRFNKMVRVGYNL